MDPAASSVQVAPPSNPASITASISPSKQQAPPTNTATVDNVALAEGGDTTATENRIDSDLTPTKTPDRPGLESADQDSTPTKTTDTVQQSDQDMTPERISKRKGLEQAYVNLATVKDVPQLNILQNKTSTVISESKPTDDAKEGVADSIVADNKMTNIVQPTSGVNASTEVTNIASAVDQVNSTGETEVRESLHDASISPKLQSENIADELVKEGHQGTAISGKDSIGGVQTVTAEGEETTSNEEVLLDQIQKQSLETAGSIQRLLHTIKVVNSPILLPADGALTEPVCETNADKAPLKGQESVGDAVIQAALTSGSEDISNANLIEEVYQPSNSAQVDDSDVVVVGEIVGGTSVSGKDPLHGLTSSVADLDIQEIEPIAPVADQGTVDPDNFAKNGTEKVSTEAESHHSSAQSASIKRPKIQLAASFKQ